MIPRLALILGLVLLPALAWAEKFGFALIGDVPYTDFERRQLPDLLDEIGRHDLAFVIHDGDIKSGDSLCTEALYLDRLALFESSSHPFIYVPGDNEWTDCARKRDGGYDQIERLGLLRNLFFADDFSLGRRKLRLERQSGDANFAEFRENVRWTRGNVLFVGLNVPGGGNNREFNGQPTKEFARRERANRTWLEKAFAKARKENYAGLVIVIQANPGFEAANAGHPPPGFRDLLAQLRRETLSYSGQVLFVHGDTHWHHIDKPLLAPSTRRPIENFTRVETFGSPFMGWVEVRVDTSDPRLFRLESHPYAPRPAQAY